MHRVLKLEQEMPYNRRHRAAVESLIAAVRCMPLLDRR
jgi:hypothetical protein